MNRLKTISLSIFVLISLLLLSGCGYRAVPSQYDLKLKTKVSELSCENGGNLAKLEITIDSRRYQDLTSDNNIFLAYHLLDTAGEVLVQDGIRTSLIPVKARGIKNEIWEVLVPLEEGDYIVEADLVEEGVTWFSAQGMETLKIPLTVQNTVIPDYSGIILTMDSTVANSADANSATDAVSADIHSPITVTIRNNSGIALCSSGYEATQLSYLIKDKKGTVLAEGGRVKLPENLASGQTGELTFTPQAELLSTPGDYMIEIDLLREGTAWFKDLGLIPLQIPVTIK